MRRQCHRAIDMHPHFGGRQNSQIRPPAAEQRGRTVVSEDEIVVVEQADRSSLPLHGSTPEQEYCAYGSDLLAPSHHRITRGRTFREQTICTPSDTRAYPSNQRRIIPWRYAFAAR